MNDLLLRTVSMMGTVVTVQVVGRGTNQPERDEREATVVRALEWFAQVEATCSRFDSQSELRRLCARVGEAVPVSEMLFEPIRFALAVAQDTEGAFDPTIGAMMEARGFNREHRTGAVANSTVATPAGASYRDLELDSEARTVTIARPLTLDLGAVAKGLAMDLAARELGPLGDFAIDAGGDVFLGGNNADGEPWSVGVRHPRAPNELLETISVSNVAVCTSGDYERAGVATDGGHHIMDARVGRSARLLASATVIAPHAMVADALATAAFVLGPQAGIKFLEAHGVAGVLYSPALERFATAGFAADTAIPHGADTHRG